MNMPKRTDISSILVIGSGPIVIGQACEFDYSGTQACKAFREEGIRVILVNSNPATIMTDPEIADATYIEPITVEHIEAIIAKERPDAVLPTVGGQTALNAAVALAKAGVLEKYGVKLIGSSLESIEMAEDRELFRDAVERCGLEMARGAFVETFEEGMKVVEAIGFPAIIRPSFTLGGSGGGVAYNIEEYAERLRSGLTASPVSRVLVEESIIGWKEYELEVMRDRKDNVVIICSIENLDPMGVHTGDSVTVAPAQTLSDREYQRMRLAAQKIIREIGVETGGSNIQFALNPNNGRLIIIEMNPRVSRSSALASKATGFPIAKIAAKLALGYTLDEIPNDITKKTPASFEPTIDYVVTKIPRWDFEKFKGVPDELGVQMKSVGEAMAIGRTFKESLQKAMRSMEKKRHGFGFDKPEYAVAEQKTEAQKAALMTRLRRRTSASLFDLCDAMRFGISNEDIFEATKYDPWFLAQIREIVDLAQEHVAKAREHGKGYLQTLSYDELRRLKAYGFSDIQLAVVTGSSAEEVAAYRKSLGVRPVYKTVDTCSAEFESSTPYHYSTYEDENESVRSEKEKVVILGGGPNRIGQGIEFDYCCVQGVIAVKQAGYEAVMINCNPETVSTDYDTVDKLYFEPLTIEDVLHVLEHEQPKGVIVTFGGQTPLKLARQIEAAGFPILGTSPEGIDLAEDREQFGGILNELNIPAPPWGTAHTEDEAVAIAHSIGYPVLVRPSYVLGGRAMQICYREESLREYMKHALTESYDRAILIDHFLEQAYELDVDAVSDGHNVIIGGIMQHIEEAGVHSGDSSCVLPPYNLTAEQVEIVTEYTVRMARRLKVVGLLNIQFAIKNNIVYVLEVNPRASRTIPFVSKATGVQVARVATTVMLGKTLPEIGFVESPMNALTYVAIKESVFPFVKFPKTNIFLSPEMRSTGEVMGIDSSFGPAIVKSRISSNNTLPATGTVFVSLSNADKTHRALDIVRGYRELGFAIWATGGTAAWLSDSGIEATKVSKHYEGRPSVIDHLKNGEISMILNTPIGENARYDEFIMGQTALEYKVPFFTTLAAAAASISGIRTLRQEQEVKVKSLQEYYGRN